MTDFTFTDTDLIGLLELKHEVSENVPHVIFMSKRIALPQDVLDDNFVNSGDVISINTFRSLMQFNINRSIKNIESGT